MPIISDGADFLNPKFNNNPFLLCYGRCKYKAMHLLAFQQIVLFWNAYPQIPEKLWVKHFPAISAHRSDNITAYQSENMKGADIFA